MDDVMTKSLAVAYGTKVLDAKEGIVSAIVAVTANRDHGGDVILPGALKWGLDAGIMPKGCVAHDWSRTASKAIEISEIAPGNTSLPGSLLSKGLGGMRVKAQFNLKTTTGRDAFEDVAFYEDEQEWSIGYAGFGTYLAGPDVNKDAWDQVCKVLPDSTIESIKSAPGATRFLPQVKTYEFSTVLFGMNADTVTESVKSGDTIIVQPNIDELVERAVAKAVEKIRVIGAPAKSKPKFDVKVTLAGAVKVWIEDDAFEGSAEAFVDAVQDAVSAWVDANVRGAVDANGVPTTSGPWARVLASYADSCIVTIDGLAPDPVTHEDEVTLRFPLSFDGENVTLGTPTPCEVEISIVDAAADAAEDAAESGGAPVGTTPADMRGMMGASATAFDVHVRSLEEAVAHVAGAVADDAKAGAVQARRNRERLTTALGAIQAMVDELPADDGDKTGEAPVDPVAALRAEIAAETADVDDLVGAAG